MAKKEDQTSLNIDPVYYQINYKYPNAKGQMRQASLLIQATDLTDARNKAEELCKAEHNWFKITNVQSA